MADGEFQETQVELHAKTCSCRGGSWVILGGVSGAPCAGSSEGPEAKVVVSMTQWRTLGKPANVEVYRETVARVEAGERREFARYAAALEVTLGRITTWKGEPAQVEQTTTEVVAKGGALVRSRMAIEKGETLSFAVGPTPR
jgi:hypothetical protein